MPVKKYKINRKIRMYECKEEKEWNLQTHNYMY